MKLARTILLIIIFATTSYAGTTASRDHAIDYLEASKTKENVETTLSTLQAQLAPQIQPEDRDNFNKLLENTVGWGAVKEDLIALVEETYTKEELQAAIDYMRTPLGSSATAKGQLFSKKFSEMLSNKLKENLTK